MSDSVDSGETPRADRPAPGRYRHYKGADYRVIDCVRHSETEEWLVLYRALYGERGLWVRPLDMFRGTVEEGGRTVPRFAFVDDDSNARTGDQANDKTGDESAGGGA